MTTKKERLKTGKQRKGRATKTKPWSKSRKKRKRN